MHFTRCIFITEITFNPKNAIYVHTLYKYIPHRYLRFKLNYLPSKMLKRNCWKQRYVDRKKKINKKEIFFYFFLMLIVKYYCIKFESSPIKTV